MKQLLSNSRARKWLAMGLLVSALFVAVAFASVAAASGRHNAAKSVGNNAMNCAVKSDGATVGDGDGESNDDGPATQAGTKQTAAVKTGDGKEAEGPGDDDGGDKEDDDSSRPN
jgi:hypothetical protein